MSQLLDKILSQANMLEAYNQVKANKGSAGIDGITIDGIDVYLRQNWRATKQLIKERKYKPQPVLRVEIPKPNGGIRLLEYLNDGYDWVVDIDLKKFFDTVPQDRLMSLVQNIIHDGDTESLIRKYLHSGVVINGQRHKTLVGTPQGGNLSPLLSNIMLNELDKELEKRGLHFVRYADDCVITVGSAKHLPNGSCTQSVVSSKNGLD